MNNIDKDIIKNTDYISSNVFRKKVKKTTYSYVYREINLSIFGILSQACDTLTDIFFLRQIKSEIVPKSIISSALTSLNSSHTEPMLKLTNSRNSDTYVVFTDDDKIVGFKGNWYDAPLNKIVVYNYKGNAENYVKKHGGTIMKTSELIFKFDEYKRVHGEVEYNKRVHND